MTARRILCVVLALTQIGCRSVYRLHCTSEPEPAGVLVGGEFLGETACTIEIPKDSEWIDDGQIELTFCLADGTQKTQIVDLRGRKPSNPLAEIVLLPFAVVGFGLLLLAGGDDEEEEDESDYLFPEDEDEDDEDDDDDVELTLLGLGAIGIGVGLHLLLGGDFASTNRCPVHADFNEPPLDN